MIRNRKVLFKPGQIFRNKKGANYETKKVCYRCQFSKNICIMSRIHPFKIHILSYFVALKTLENIVSSVVSDMSLLHINKRNYNLLDFLNWNINLRRYIGYAYATYTNILSTQSILNDSKTI